MADEKIYTNIGHATAYAYAKSKGYTGTEDQFATDQANFAANAQQVREDKESVETTVATFGNTTVPAAVQTVTAEGTRQVGIVGTAGDTQVARVQAEGTTQKNAVKAKGEEVIASIPSDYTELTEEVEDLKSAVIDVENAIIVSEESITMDNTLYADIGELTVGKYYRIGITTNIAGTYTVHVATAPSAGAVVGDPIFNNVTFDQNETKYIIYKPSVSGIRYIRFSTYNVIWTCDVAEWFDPVYFDENTVQYHSEKTIYLDQNTLSTSSPVTMSEGWSGDYASGFTNTAGNTGSMYFGGGTTSGAKYVVEFDASGVTDSRLFVRIGNNAKVDVYNGTNHFIVGFVSDGGNLMFTPTTSFTGTLSNITLRKVLTTGGTPFTIGKKTVNHQQTEDDISGFWNVAIGAENTQDSNVNGSRNIGIGYSSQHLLESGTRNIGIGTFSMPFVKDGDRNIAIGADSLYSTRNHSHTHAEDCIAIGYRAMSDGTNIKYNVAIGTNAMKESTDEATYNVCVGAGAGTFANYGLTAIGYNACAKSYTKADASVFVGRNSGVDNTGATAQSPKNVSNVIAIGDGVLVKNTNDARFGNASNVIYLAGKRIVFNDDHTVIWEEDT